MTDDSTPQATPAPDSQSNPQSPDTPTPKAPPTVLQCLNGGAIAGALAWVAYGVTQKIAGNFAAHPFQSSNYIAVNISVAVRTLVVGLFALATAVFAITALGILGLGLQTLIRKGQDGTSAS